MHALNFDLGVYAGKSLSDRNSGKFYTPDFLADHLAGQVIASLSADIPLSGTLSICDPFCGNGQLVLPLLLRVSKLDRRRELTIRVVLRDIDGEAVRVAGNRVAELAASLGIDAKIDAAVMDSFGAYAGAHDIVVTNPPWEQLKPDSRETAHLSGPAQAEYVTWLRQRSLDLDARFGEARAAVRWGSWNTNLARCGWAVALRSCRHGGALGIILPGSIFADRASSAMRQAALTRSDLISLSTFPSEARLFAKVDQPVVSAVFRSGSVAHGLNLPVLSHDQSLAVVASHRLVVSQSDLHSTGFSIPLTDSPGSQSAMALLREHPMFRDLEGKQAGRLWAGRELDETRVSEKLEIASAYPFVKGRMIKRRGLAEVPSLSVRPQHIARLGSVSHQRLVWRDVARSTQKRRMISTIIPSGWVAGNSLHVAHFRDGCSEKLHALHAVVSSIVFEAQVRSMSSTGHLSLGIVRNARVPEMTPLTIVALAKADRRAENSLSGERMAEVAVARAYGLTRDSFAALLTHLPKIEGEERASLLDKQIWASQ